MRGGGCWRRPGESLRGGGLNGMAALFGTGARGGHGGPGAAAGPLVVAREKGSGSYYFIFSTSFSRVARRRESKEWAGRGAVSRAVLWEMQDGGMGFPIVCRAGFWRGGTGVVQNGESIQQLAEIAQASGGPLGASTGRFCGRSRAMGKV